MNINVEAWRGRDRLKKRWIDCVGQDMREMDMNDEMTTDKGEYKEKIKYAELTANELEQGQKEEEDEHTLSSRNPYI
jgi:hypothetical protein